MTDHRHVEFNRKQQCALCVVRSNVANTAVIHVGRGFFCASPRTRSDSDAGCHGIIPRASKRVGWCIMQFAMMLTARRRICSTIVNHLEHTRRELAHGVSRFAPPPEYMHPANNHYGHLPPLITVRVLGLEPGLGLLMYYASFIQGRH